MKLVVRHRCLFLLVAALARTPAPAAAPPPAASPRPRAMTVKVHRAWVCPESHGWKARDGQKIVAIDLDFRNVDSGLDLDDVELVDTATGQALDAGAEAAFLHPDGRFHAWNDAPPSGLRRVLLVFEVPSGVRSVRLRHWADLLTPRPVPFAPTGPAVPPMRPEPPPAADSIPDSRSFSRVEAVGRSGPGRMPGPDLVAALTRQADAWDEAIVRKDLAAIASNMAPDFRQIRSDGSLVDRDTFLRDITSPDLVIDPYTVEDFDVRILGDVALLYGRTRMTGRFAGEPFTSHYRYIDAYVRRGGQWKVCSVQTTPVREPAPAK